MKLVVDETANVYHGYHATVLGDNAVLNVVFEVLPAFSHPLLRFYLIPDGFLHESTVFWIDEALEPQLRESAEIIKVIAAKEVNQRVVCKEDLLARQVCLVDEEGARNARGKSLDTESEPLSLDVRHEGLVMASLALSADLCGV